MISCGERDIGISGNVAWPRVWRKSFIGPREIGDREGDCEWLLVFAIDVHEDY